MGTFIGIKSEIDYDRDHTKHYLINPSIVRNISVRGGIPIVIPTPMDDRMNKVLNICDGFVELNGDILYSSKDYAEDNKPIIGIITTPDFDENNNPKFLMDPRIVNWCYECGGIPIGIVPPRDVNYHIQGGPPSMTSEEIEKLNRILEICDGFVKPGGYTLTDYHKFIYKYTVENDVPFLGICAGIQLMAFCAEDKPQLALNKNHDLHKKNGESIHEIVINPKSKLYRIVGEFSLSVKSNHKKHITSVNNLLVAAISSDNQIEALENPNCTYNLGLQFHPEAYNPCWRHDGNYKYSKRIFESFIKSSNDYRLQKAVKHRV